MNGSKHFFIKDIIDIIVDRIHNINGLHANLTAFAGSQCMLVIHDGVLICGAIFLNDKVKSYVNAVKHSAYVYTDYTELDIDEFIGMLLYKFFYDGDDADLLLVQWRAQRPCQS